MPIAIALLAGIVFGAGLAIADMVNPARVLNFLDVAGNWDPSLAFVMAGGLAITAIGYRLIFRRPSPLCAEAFHIPAERRITLSLVAGAALFGIGWGLAGICPGPVLANLATLQPKILAFIAAMAAGMLGMRTWQGRGG